LTRLIKTGTSINGPITAAKAWPEFIPNTPVATVIAAKQLKKAGFEVYAGQPIQYLIVNSKNERSNKRVLAPKLLKSDNQYDVDECLNLLISAAETLLGAFGYT
jgi:DNA polymerase elongation subunit (family B)